MSSLPDADTAAEIGELYRKARSTAEDALRQYHTCGVRLREATEALPHGELDRWLESHKDALGFGRSTAFRLMKLSKVALARQMTAERALEISRILWGHEPTKIEQKPKREPRATTELVEVDEPEDGWVAFLENGASSRCGETFATKEEAERDAEEWRQHIAGLKRKPGGSIHVITTEKLSAMAWSCAIKATTTEEETAEILREVDEELATKGKTRDSVMADLSEWGRKIAARDEDETPEQYAQRDALERAEDCALEAKNLAKKDWPKIGIEITEAMVLAAKAAGEAWLDLALYLQQLREARAPEKTTKTGPSSAVLRQRRGPIRPVTLNG